MGVDLPTDTLNVGAFTLTLPGAQTTDDCEDEKEQE